MSSHPGEPPMGSSDKRVLQETAQRAVSACRKGDYEGALRELESVLAVYKNDIGRLPARLLSYYGVCLAESRGKVADGLEFCRTSIAKDPFHADHYANLARLYHLRRARKRAVQALGQATNLDIENTLVGNLWEEMGRRRPPVLRFLHRDHPLNIFFGKVRGKLGG